MASAPGKKSKAKEKERMERQARALEEADDVDDWFARATKQNPGLPKRPTSQSAHHSSKKASTSGSNSNSNSTLLPSSVDTMAPKREVCHTVVGHCVRGH